MKAPYTYPPFHVTSSHYCTVFGVGECLELGGGCQNTFVCVCMSVCMCVLSRSSKTLDGASEEEEMYRKILIFGI